MKNRVSFRKFPEGDIIALFPDVEHSPGLIESYQTIGQHSGADPSLLSELEKATREESLLLARELEKIGYSLKEC